jgi:hypothetical protein
MRRESFGRSDSIVDLYFIVGGHIWEIRCLSTDCPAGDFSIE